jgi:hypothetical protein
MTDTSTVEQVNQEWTDGTDEPIETEAVETETAKVEQPKVKVPETLKVRVALALTFSPKDFGMEDVTDINKFRWLVREHVAKLIAEDQRFQAAKTVTKVMPD